MKDEDARDNGVKGPDCLKVISNNGQYSSWLQEFEAELKARDPMWEMAEAEG